MLLLQLPTEAPSNNEDAPNVDQELEESFKVSAKCTASKYVHHGTNISLKGVGGGSRGQRTCCHNACCNSSAAVEVGTE
jgi:hypothetical protein